MKEKRLYGLTPLREFVHKYAEDVVKTENDYYGHLQKTGMWDLLDLDYWVQEMRGHEPRYPALKGYYIYDFIFGKESLGDDYRYTGEEPLGYEKKPKVAKAAVLKIAEIVDTEVDFIGRHTFARFKKAINKDVVEAVFYPVWEMTADLHMLQRRRVRPLSLAMREIAEEKARLAISQVNHLKVI